MSEEQTHSNPPPESNPEDTPPCKSCLSRRKFVAMTGLGAVGVGYAAGMAYPIYRYLVDPAERAEAEAAITEIAIPKAELPPIGQSKTVKFGIRPALIIHHDDGSWTCFDAVCTHLGCTVAFQPEHKRIYCACHGGQYDMNTGENVAGPPPRPLKVFNVEETDEQLIIRRA